MLKNRTWNEWLALLTIVVFIVFQAGICGTAQAGDFAKTIIKHGGIDYFVPGKRILVKAQIKNPKGIELARCYFRSGGESDYVFVTMETVKENIFQAVLPAPSEAVGTIEYLFLTVTKENQIVKTQTFSSEMKETRNIPSWQDVPGDNELTVFTELPDAPAQVQGFSDSIQMDVVESSGRFGFTAGGIYAFSKGAAGSGMGAATGAAAAASATTVTTAGVGLSTAVVVGSVAAAVAAGGAAVASNSSSGSDGSSSNGYYFISVYSIPQGQTIYTSSGTNCEIEITCGFNSQAEAVNGLQETNFSLLLNGDSLSPQGSKGIFQDGNGWHVYQSFNTGPLQSGSYLVEGITHGIDSRAFIIQVQE